MKPRLVTFAGLLAVALAMPALAQKKYDAGASDKSIAAYFRMLNDRGGINGRRVNFISYDDGYSPPKTVEMVRKLVEQDEVLLLFQTLGTPSNTAIHKYMNTKKVP